MNTFLRSTAIDQLGAGDIGCSTMTLAETLISIWQQVLVEGKSTIDLEGRTYPVGSTRAKKMRTVRFD